MVPDWSSIWSTLQSSGIIPEILSERFHNLRAKLSERLVPKAGVLFPLKAPSGHKRSCFIDIDEERLVQDGRILVYDLVYFAQALASQTKQTFSAALTAIWKRVPWGQRAIVHGPRAALHWFNPLTMTPAVNHLKLKIDDLS
jgi:hypothetical protein